MVHGFQEHWLNIDDERMERYETMFRWNPQLLVTAVR